MKKKCLLCDEQYKGDKKYKNICPECYQKIKEEISPSPQRRTVFPEDVKCIDYHKMLREKSTKEIDLKLEDVPEYEELIGTKWYKTKNATLLAYDIVLESYFKIYEDKEFYYFIGLYKTKKDNYFLYFYHPAYDYSKDILPQNQENALIEFMRYPYKKLTLEKAFGTTLEDA